VELSDGIGFAGVALILVAFVLNIARRLDRETPAYLLLNLVGATLACVSSAMIGFIPFVILEGVWAAVALGGLIVLGARTRRGELSR
jgi:hypothetical protein